MKEIIECNDCWEEFDTDDEMYDVGNGFGETLVCEDCMDEYVVCNDCDNWHLADDSTFLTEYEIPVCDDCLDVNYMHTDCCHEYVRNDEVVIATDSDNIYCSIECLTNDGGFICEHCENYYQDYSYGGQDDWGNPECDNCHEEDSPNIRAYHDNPVPRFFGNPKHGRFFGVELELDNGDYNSFAEEVNEHTEERLFLMEDGSLDDGVEVITHPLSLDVHMNGGLWEKVRDTALDYGLRSHDAGTCGLHIHVSRRSLGEGKNTEKDAIDNVVFIVERFWDKMKKFSRRTDGQLYRWADRFVEKDNCNLLMLDEIKKARKDGRYRSVNLSPSRTIEFRFFRGTLNLSTLYASLELVNHICNVATNLSEDELDNITWTEFINLAKDDGYEYLFDYLKERDIEPDEDECKANIALREVAKKKVIVDRAREHVEKVMADAMGRGYALIRELKLGFEEFRHGGDDSARRLRNLFFEPNIWNTPEPGQLATIKRINHSSTGNPEDYESFTYMSKVIRNETRDGRIVTMPYDENEEFYIDSDKVVNLYETKGVTVIERLLFDEDVVYKPLYMGISPRVSGDDLLLILDAEPSSLHEGMLKINEFKIINHHRVLKIEGQVVAREVADGVLAIKDAVEELIESESYDELEKFIKIMKGENFTVARSSTTEEVNEPEISQEPTEWVRREPEISVDIDSIDTRIYSSQITDASRMYSFRQPFFGGRVASSGNDSE